MHADGEPPGSVLGARSGSNKGKKYLLGVAEQYSAFFTFCIRDLEVVGINNVKSCALYTIFTIAPSATDAPIQKEILVHYLERDYRVFEKKEIIIAAIVAMLHTLPVHFVIQKS